MAFFHTHFAKVSAKTALVNPKLIHLLFALTATTSVMTGHLKPLALHYWSTQENLPLLLAEEVDAQQRVRVAAKHMSPPLSQRMGEISAQHINRPLPQVGEQEMPDLFALPSFSFFQGASTHFMSSHNSLPPKPNITPGAYKDTRKSETKREADTATVESPENQATVLSLTSTSHPVRTAFKQQLTQDSIEKTPLPPSDYIEPNPQPQPPHPQPQPPYQYTSKAIQLQFWLQMLGYYGGSVPEEPFRQALINTLLSPKFQPFVTDSWVDDEDDEVTVRNAAKQKRNEFFYDYMNAVDWKKTPFKRLFLVPRSNDMHQVDEDAFIYGYEFPEKIGLRGIYKCCDIECKEELLLLG